MKFANKYGNVAFGEFSPDGYYLKGQNGKCTVCGCPCEFIEINYEAWFCSEECINEFESQIQFEEDYGWK